MVWHKLFETATRHSVTTCWWHTLLWDCWNFCTTSTCLSMWTVCVCVNTCTVMPRCTSQSARQHFDGSRYSCAQQQDCKMRERALFFSENLQFVLKLETRNPYQHLSCRPPPCGGTRTSWRSLRLNCCLSDNSRCSSKHRSVLTGCWKCSAIEVINELFT